MKKKSVGINSILNAIKAMFSIVFPLITFPYATRVLGVENLGKVNYAQSIEYYFSIIAALGITAYAVREGAKIRDNKEKMKLFCNEIFTLNILTTILSYILLFIFLLISSKMKNYILLILIQSISILFSTIGIEWLNTIYEDFLYITIRSFIINIISIVALFLFVKNPSDYYVYCLITVLCNGFISILNIVHCRKYAKLGLCFNKKIFKHLKSSIVFFANKLSISIYVSSDTTMLGWICGDFFVGLYSVSVKVYNIVKTILAAFYSASISRLSYLHGKGETDKYKVLLSKIISNISLLIFPCMIGLICLSKEIVLILAGEKYIESTVTLQILSLALIFAIFGGIVTNCVNVPLGREVVNMKATMFSAVVNIVLNIFIIPKFHQNGAAITSVISEIVVLLICINSFKEWNKIIDFKLIKKNLFDSMIGMISIFSVCYLVSIFKIPYLFLNIIIKVICSIVIYFICLILLKNEIIYGYLNKIKRINKRR